MKHTAIYLRVSSKAQDTISQQADIDRWVQAYATNPVYYSDKFTGRTMNRPGFNSLLADIRLGKVADVVVWRLDRLGRTAKGLTALFEDLRKANVNLVSIKDGLDLSTPAGRLMANVLASVAAYETEIRAERIMAGQAAARAKGKKWGGSKKGRHITITPEQIAMIRTLKKSGTKIAVIARTVGIARPTVYDILNYEKTIASLNKPFAGPIIKALDALRVRAEQIIEEKPGLSDFVSPVSASAPAPATDSTPT